MAAWWNQDGPGGWSSEGCKLRFSRPNVSSLYCQHLGNVAVLMVCIMEGGVRCGEGGQEMCVGGRDWGTLITWSHGNIQKG